MATITKYSSEAGSVSFYGPNSSSVTHGLAREKIYKQVSYEGDKIRPNTYQLDISEVFHAAGHTITRNSGNAPNVAESGAIGNIAVPWGTYAGNGLNAHSPSYLLDLAVKDAARNFYKRRNKDNIDVGSDVGEAAGGNYEGFDPRIKKAAENANRNIGKGTIGIAGDLWLTKAFAIQPLVGSVFTTLERQGKMFATGSRTVTGRGKAMNSGQFSSLYGQSFGGARGCVKTSACAVEAYAEYRAKYAITDPLLHEINKWTTFNPALIAWNRLPASWIVDYFFGIGDYLAGLEGMLDIGLTFKYGYLSTLTIERKVASISGTNSGPDPTGIYNVGYLYTNNTRTEQKIISQRRTKILGSPTMPRPEFNWDLTSGQMTNLGIMAQKWMS